MFALTPFGRRAALDSYDPFREFENFSRRFFQRESFPSFSVDIREEKDSYLLEADLPGFSKEDIHIDVEGQYLTIRAERRTEGEREEEGKYLRTERAYGAFSRTFDLAGVDAESLRATYRDGVLSLTMPKKKEKTVERRELAIE